MTRSGRERMAIELLTLKKMRHRALWALCLLGAALQAFGQTPLYRHIGCFRDADMGGGQRVIPPLEHSDEVLDGNYKGRKGAIMKCAIAAWKKELPGFAVQDGGWCGGSSDILDKHDMWGSAEQLQPPYNCVNGKGGMWANDVYEITGVELAADSKELR